MSPRFWQIVHNVIAHPLWEVLPRTWGDWLHDWTYARGWPGGDQP